MNHLLIGIVSVLLVSCQTHRLPLTEEMTIDNFKPGKCYFTQQINNEIEKGKNAAQKAFVLEVIEPKYQLSETSYLSNDLKSEMGENDYLKIKTTEAHVKYVISYSNLFEYTTIKNPIGFVYCLAEIPSIWKTIYKKDLVQDSIKLVEKRIIEESKIIKTFVDKKPKTLRENQRYFKSNMWSNPKEVVLINYDDHIYDIVHLVKKALIELGYELKLDDKLDEETKKALINFQQNNNLKTGNLDYQTLKILGIK